MCSNAFSVPEIQRERYGRILGQVYALGGLSVHQFMVCAAWAYTFAPRGNRGMGAQAVRAGLYGRIPDYLERIANESMMIIQIESRKGLENLEEICSVPGIGAIFLGPIDLAVDMGHGLNIFHPEVVDAMEYMIKKVKSLGIPVGTIAVTPEQAKNYKDFGISFLAVGGDTMLLASAADETHQNYFESLK